MKHKQLSINHSGSLAAALIFIAFSGGCAATEIRSFTDPDFESHRYDRIMVAVMERNLDQRDEAETIFSETLSHPNVSCVRAIDVLPPTRKVNDQEFANAVIKAGVDSIMIIRETEYYEDKKYIPQRAITQTTGTLDANTYYYRSSASTYGNLNATSYTQTAGGYFVSRPRVRHEVELWDVKAVQRAWIGGAFTKGNRRAKFKHLISSLASEVADQLQKDGLLPPKTKDESKK